MALLLIKPGDLPVATAVDSDAAVMVQNGEAVERASPQQVVDAGRPIASEAQAVTGTDNTTAMTPLTTRQAINADTSGSVALAVAAAEAAEASALDAESAEEQTSLDALATAADRVLTGLDATATAADRVQTGLDVASTAADAIATAADRVQTGLDVTATNADALATAADRVQTALDAAATAADRVQTGLDRAATEAAAGIAQTIGARPRNLCMTGNFDLFQRGYTSLTNIPHLGIVAARWVFGQISGTAQFTMAQSSDVPDIRSLNSLSTVVTTTSASPAAGTEAHVRYALEGRQSALIFADKVCSLKFKVKASVPGTYSVAFVKPYSDLSGVDTFIAEYTVNAANTWETKRLVVDLSQSANRTWHTGNNIALRFRFCYYAGSTYRAAPGWNVGNFVGSTNQVNMAATMGASHQISQVDFYVGDYDRPFVPDPIEDVLLSVQRYEAVIGGGGLDSVGFAGYASAAGQDYYWTITYPTTMRDVPTVQLGTFSIANAGTPVFTPGLRSGQFKLVAVAAGRLAARSDVAGTPILLTAEL